MSNIYLHVGAHKSASTTLQRNLKVNEQLLKERTGLSYFGGTDIHKSPLERHFRVLSRGGFLDNQAGYEESCNNAKEFLNDYLISGVDDALISWEGFLGHSSLDKYNGIYTHYKEVVDSIEKIFSGHNLRIVMIVRCQDTFIESCYLQQIKENRSINFDEFVENININCMSWKEICEYFYDSFDERVCFCPFEYIKYNGSSDFIFYTISSLLNRPFDMSGMKIIEKANASFSREGVDISRSLLPKLSPKNKSTVNKILFSEFSSNKGTKPKFFNEFARGLIKKSENCGNRVVFDKYFSREVGDLKFDIDSVKKDWFL